jgi:polysaccharide biosynthesis protein PslG
MLNRFPERIALVLCIMGVLLLAASCQPDQPVSPTPVLPPDVPVDQLLPSPAPAVHVSLWWNEEIAHRDMGLVQDMGFHWIKQPFAWRDIETHEKGRYDWWRTDRIVKDAEERDLNLIVRLDRQPFWAQVDGGVVHLENAPPRNMQDFGDFCYAVASRYAGRIRGYQIWNEPNLAREWGEQPPDPEQYVVLLKTCYEGIKRGDPAALVISAGMAPTGTGLPVAMPDEEYIRRIYEAGGAEYFDVLGVNAPGFAAPPETSPEEAASTVEYGGYRWAAFRHVEDIRSLMIEMGDGHKQIAILEMGWTTDPDNPTYSWFRVTEEQQADYLVRAYWWAYNYWRPWIGLMTTIYIPDPYWTEENEQYWWSISLPDWPETKTRPAYDALSTLPNWGGQMPDTSP